MRLAPQLAHCWAGQSVPHLASQRVPLWVQLTAAQMVQSWDEQKALQMVLKWDLLLARHLADRTVEKKESHLAVLMVQQRGIGMVGKWALQWEQRLEQRKAA